MDHETIAICRREQVEPVDLNHCLRAFTSEEKLEQWYHCSHCKGKKPATKKLQIWKLPPILVSATSFEVKTELYIWVLLCRLSI